MIVGTGAQGVPLHLDVGLIGREAERDAMQAVLQRASTQGRAGGVALEGEAGIGKSQLLAETQRHASLAGWTVFAGRAHDLGVHRPFGLAASLRRVDTDTRQPPLLADVLRASASTGGDDVRGARFVDMRAGEALYDAIEQACRSSRVLLVIDDLHWADPESVGVLTDVVRETCDLPLVTVVAYRPLRGRAELARFVHEVTTNGIRCQLGPLDDGAANALLTALVGSDPAESLTDEVAKAAGNPLFVIELVASLHQSGDLALGTDGRVEATRAGPSALNRATLQRLSLLSPPTLELLSVASVFGPAFTASDLQLVLGRRAADLAAPLQDALAAGVLTEDGDSFAFRHELIRNTLYEDMPASVRAALHRELATLLLDERDDAPAAASTRCGRAGGMRRLPVRCMRRRSG